MSYFKGIGRKSGSYTGRKLPLVGLLENKKHTIFNEYVPGSGVGASSVVSRRLKKQRARIKKCTPPEPILPKFGDDEVFVIDDEVSDFNEGLEAQINALDLEMTYNFGNDNNSSVDGKSFEVIAKKHLNALATSSESTSLTFTVLSETNPAVNAVNETESTDLNTLLLSTDYNIIISEPITYTDSDISQQTSHTFIYTGNSDGKPNIEYIMSITDYSQLQ